jgi:hypothetical protein
MDDYKITILNVEQYVMRTIDEALEMVPATLKAVALPHGVKRRMLERCAFNRVQLVSRRREPPLQTG